MNSAGEWVEVQISAERHGDADRARGNNRGWGFSSKAARVRPAAPGGELGFDKIMVAGTGKDEAARKLCLLKDRRAVGCAYRGFGMGWVVRCETSHIACRFGSRWDGPRDMLESQVEGSLIWCGTPKATRFMIGRTARTDEVVVCRLP